MKLQSLSISATLLAAAFFFTNVCTADEPANSTLVIDDTFDRAELGKGWNPTCGEWKIVDGVLQGREIKEEKHAAANRRVVSTKNAVYELNFRLTGKCKAFHFGFDPARGELDKKGHLFSVIVSPGFWQIMKHVDKNKRQEDPNEILIKQETKFDTDTWYKLRVTTWGNYVTARIEGKADLKTSHPTFGVKKPSLVFRCVGDGVEISDVKVWTQNE